MHQYLQANASAADPYPYMLVIDVAGLLSTMTTNRMILTPRGAVVVGVNQSLGCFVPCVSGTALAVMDRQTDRQKDRQRDRQTERQSDRQRDRERERKREKDGQTDGQKDRQTDRQTDST